jgi:hypothetical protein
MTEQDRTMEGNTDTTELETSKLEMLRLTEELKSANERQKMALQLAASTARTVHDYTRGIARIAEVAFNLTAGLEELIGRSESMARELTYVQWATAQGEISPDALGLLARQIHNVGTNIEQLREELVSEDIQLMRDQGETERQGAEDRQWQRQQTEHERIMRDREDRKDSIFEDDPENYTGM